VPNLQGVLPHDNALNQQVQERLLVGEGRMRQARADALTERREVSQDGRGVGALPAQAFLL
jgi:hypothetical protein